MRAITKKDETVSLEMTQLEAAYLHAFLGQFSSNEFIRNIKDAIKDLGDDCTFLPKDFNVQTFDEELRKANNSYYFTLDAALKELRDGEPIYGN